jgi:hypothetical protein
MVYDSAEYISYINGLLPDNATQEISPQDLRSAFFATTDSLHLLLNGAVDTSNLSTPDDRNTAVGISALGKINLPGYSSSDSTALGHMALHGNYVGIKNTAVGSNSMSCNIYGNYDVGVGYGSLAGNIRGSGNVGIGSHTLHSNKDGNFNIAIGHGAGYYIDNFPANLAANSYKLFVGVHGVDSDSVCDADFSLAGSPLLYGDLKTLQMAVATSTLHGFGTLQVGGDVTPSTYGVGSVGNAQRSWASLVVDSGISYHSASGMTIGYYTPLDQGQYPDQYIHSNVLYLDGDGRLGLGAVPSGQGLMTVAGNIVPDTDGLHKIGTPDLMWDGFFNDLVVSGNATINDLQYNTINECLYDCKTLHLATSGFCDPSGGLITSAVCGYLSDEAVDGAGFEVHSSGSDYQRDYQFIYKFPNQELTCLEDDTNYSRSRWYSNISLEIAGGRHVQTDRILGDDRVSVVSQSGCYGMFVRGGNQRTYSGPESLVQSQYNSEFNVVNSGNVLVGAYSTDRGSVVRNSLLVDTNGAGAFVGFAADYFDANASSGAQALDKYSLKSFSTNYSDNTEPFVVMRRYGSGLVGITNIPVNNFTHVPATIFNVQASSSCDVRFSSRSATPSRVQILSNGNLRASGTELTYSPSTQMFDISTLRASGAGGASQGAVSVDYNGYMGVGTTHHNYVRRFSAVAPFTLNYDGSLSGTMALRSQSNSPTQTANYGKLYVKPYAGYSQTEALYFTDGGGNEFRIPLNHSTDDSLLYTDANENTHGGIDAPITRPVSGGANKNTSFGHSSLRDLGLGDENSAFGAFAGANINTSTENTVVGSYAAMNLEVSGTASTKNTIVGSEAALGVIAGDNNVIIGARTLFTGTTGISNSILIGSSLKESGLVSDYSLMIGNGQIPLIEGVLGPNAADRKAWVNTDDFSLVYSFQKTSLLTAQATDKFIGKTDNRRFTTLQIRDNDSGIGTSSFGGNIAGGLSLDFANASGESGTLMSFSYNAVPMSTGVTWDEPSSARPYAELRGDLRLVGDILFSDGSTLNSSFGSTFNAGTGVRSEAVTGATQLHLDFTGLIESTDITPIVDTQNSYLALGTASGASEPVGKININTLSSLVASGYASVSDNCNHVFTNSSVLVGHNSSSVFIGCDVATSATGWKHSVMIGSEAGKLATTPNVGLATDTASTFIGYRAGYNADNIENSTFIGTNAGKNAIGASDSVFLGSSAGLDSSYNNSIGIGEHALRGDGTTETGQDNIEIVVGKLDSQRLLYNSPSASGKININNVLAGDTYGRMLSIGDAILAPDAPLSVRKDDTIPEHAAVSPIQTWYCNDTKVAEINCSGFEQQGLPLFIEGVTSSIAAPGALGGLTSGVVAYRDEDWNIDGYVYLVNRDPSLTINAGLYYNATLVNGTYRPTWVGCS